MPDETSACLLYDVQYFDVTKTIQPLVLMRTLMNILL